MRSLGDSKDTLVLVDLIEPTEAQRLITG